MALVISLLNQKGGSGKTTIATNLACGLKKKGYKTLLVDSDPQGSARDWNECNEASLIPVIGLDRETLPKDLSAVSDHYDIVIIDGAPQIQQLSAAAVKASDIILIPVHPSPYDIWAASDLVDLIKTRQSLTEGMPKAAFIVSRAIKNTNLSKDVSDALTSYGLPIFTSRTSQRVAYPASAAEGKTVYEHKKDIDAQKGIESLISELEDFAK